MNWIQKHKLFNKTKMETVNISVVNAITAYEKADKPGKDLLLNLIGKNVLLRTIMDRVKTVADMLIVAEAAGYITEEMRAFLAYKGSDTEMIASVTFMKITLLAKVLNQGWTPNWDDSNEKKWYPYFDMRAGVGFSLTGYGRWRTGALAGSRLYYKSEELARYAGTQPEFLELYKSLHKK